MKRRSRIHRVYQRKAAGKYGKIEVPVKIGKRYRKLDVVRRTKAIEIERSKDSKRILLACKRLRASRKKHKIQAVPRSNIPEASRIAQKVCKKIKVVPLKKLDNL